MNAPVLGHACLRTAASSSSAAVLAGGTQWVPAGSSEHSSAAGVQHQQLEQQTRRGPTSGATADAQQLWSPGEGEALEAAAMHGLGPTAARPEPAGRSATTTW